ncbi:hypothetical protein TNCV_2925011 [Trichonephila clavipes]|nr:hypothetical protein TNCV_2925011 [Trichonephila clavipes]
MHFWYKISTKLHRICCDILLKERKKPSHWIEETSSKKDSYGVVGLEGDNDEEEKSRSTPPGKLIQEGLQLCSKLENHFLINAPNSEQASKKFTTQAARTACLKGCPELFKKIKRILIAV